MEYFDYNNNITPGKGKVLISEPFLPDSNFERSVILLCDHTEEGSFGFVLNRPLEISLNDVMEEWDAGNSPLFMGGPVQQNTFHFLHKQEKISGSKKVANGIYWGGDFDEVMELMKVGLYKEKDFKFFLGYSGWGETQLEDEIKSGSWIVTEKIDPVMIFHTHPQDMWKIALRSLGGRFNIYSNYPVDPRLN